MFNQYLTNQKNLLFLPGLHSKYPVLKLLIPIVNDYSSNCNFNLKKAFGLKQRKIIILKFCLYLCLQYALTIIFYGFDLSFLKLVLKRTLHGLLRGKVYLLFSIILNPPPPPVWGVVPPLPLHPVSSKVRLLRMPVKKSRRSQHFVNCYQVMLKLRFG